MAECERMSSCPFFSDKMANMPSVAEVMKRKYCLDDKSLCARYQAALAGLAVPSDLFPNDTKRLQQLLGRRP